MSFTPLNALLVATIRETLGENATAAELGNQRFKATNKELGQVYEFAKKSLKFADLNALQELIDLPTKARMPLTEKYFAALGFAKYVAIDVNDKFDSKVMDLNKSLADEYDYNETFDLVVNNGTGEHIFDQRAVFENMHNLCKVGGVMINILPFANFMNHGFYNFHPTLFLDIAAANEYQILAIAAGNRWGTLGFMTGPLNRALLDAESIPIELLTKPIEGRSPWGAPPLRWARILADRFGYYDTPKRRLEKAMKHVMRDSVKRENVDHGNVFCISVQRKTDSNAFIIPGQGRFIPSFDDDIVATNYNAQSNDISNPHAKQ